jgi:hypothetical protein
MRNYRFSVVFYLCAALCHAQATKTDQALLSEAHEKYDAPFNRNLESFDCAVAFSWKDHFIETTRVGDGGTSMIGNSQGETEIPFDLAEGVLPTGKAFAQRTVLDPLTRPTHKQRGQTSICGNNAV